MRSREHAGLAGHQEGHRRFRLRVTELCRMAVGRHPVDRETAAGAAGLEERIREEP